MLDIKTGKQNRAQKVVIYGAEGIGKTTFASKFPNPLFIDTENGTGHLDVRRIDTVVNWDALLDIIDDVVKTPSVCKTLIIDTIDWAEQMATERVCTTYNKRGIEDFGYGKGYSYLADLFNVLLSRLENVINAGINVVLIAHAQMRKFEQPDESGAYDRWELKLSKRTCPIVKEWCDALFFCNYKTFVTKSSSTEKAKVHGGDRVIYTTHHPCWDAKNRYGLPDEIPMDYSQIEKFFCNVEPQEVLNKKELLEEVESKMAEDGITADMLQSVVAARGNYREEISYKDYEPSFLKNWVLVHWEKIVDMAKSINIFGG